jgi:hypothetical protein
LAALAAAAAAADVAAAAAAAVKYIESDAELDCSGEADDYKEADTEVEV